MRAQHRLPSHLKGAAIDALRRALERRRGGDLDLVATHVKIASNDAASVIVGAFADWRQDGRRLRIVDPSPCVLKQFLAATAPAAGEGRQA